MLRHKISTQLDKKISKTGFITVEPPYHVQVWEYPPWGLTFATFIIIVYITYTRVSISYVSSMNDTKGPGLFPFKELKWEG